MSFRFVEMEMRRVRLPFRFSFRHALADRRENETLLLRVRTDAGAEGFGEVLPRKYLTGETVESAWRDVRDLWWRGVSSLVFDASASPLDKLHPIHLLAQSIRKTASYGGLEVAVMDAWARIRGESLGAFLGPAAPAPLTAPLGTLRGYKLKGAIRAFRFLGFRQFKIKVGFPDDLDRVRTARAALAAGDDLRADANAAWHPNEAIDKARRLRDLGISSLEQPIAPGDPDALAHIQQAGGLPLVADESLCTLDDARALGRAGAAAIWNLRLAKVGGFSGMRAMIELAREFGVRLHLGVLVGETALLSSAQRACLGMADWRHVEYGFSRILLKRDPFRGGAGGYFGSAAPLSSRPGLGLRCSPKVLGSISQESKTCYSHLEEGGGSAEH